MMVCLTSLPLLLAVSVCAAAATVGPLPRSDAASYYWSSWNDGTAKISTTNGPEGKFGVKWSGNKGNFVVGKGWNPGGPRSVNYSGTFAPNGNGYLSIYGWTTNPLVEYYIVEAYGTHKPSNTSEAKMKGNMTSDGGSYEIMTKQRVNKPSIQGTATFAQYWSIRTENRVGGTVTTGNHFKAWEAAGLKMGRHSYMIVAVEGQDSNGQAEITVGVAPPAPTATATAS
ncbi:concanavalin A-like lectin/glucanase domain-containing protein [Diplogelasinospora grovesii]|uniref:Endo-1,4-beta-xylanase n=1 Tax=Diplogelasinospora grovesii TaxID=303347 RepID=A0AAN6SAF1_9PEZI|nr:concanavalin A-like lectin/glucanase domain-containing protein [Diplogelasinospora grovesii]